ncbi:hypothetical protein, partial [Candidatus Entotheonella palauensis]|uniref:hypothetical protein n=1 Tax=Candidatus Entotheonella palauensis TaxID=93172 RepID=UPI001C4DE559
TTRVSKPGFFSWITVAAFSSMKLAKAGVLVPVFGVPGPNPDDATHNQFDPFWQYHLCNYLFYFDQQYSSS